MSERRIEYHYHASAISELEGRAVRRYKEVAQGRLALRNLVDMSLILALRHGLLLAVRPALPITPTLIKLLSSCVYDCVRAKARAFRQG